MKSAISTKQPLSVQTPLLAVIVTQGFVPLKEANVERAVASGDYKGKKDETLLVYAASKGGPERILLVSAGKSGEITRSSIRRATAIAAKRARALGTTTFALTVTPEARGGLGAAELAQVAIEGAAQGG